jgi:uncharacterized membrane protein YhaH (DUF805 family)
MDFFALFFSIKGRIGRLRFWVGWLTLLVLGNASSMLLRDLLEGTADPQLVDFGLTLLFAWPDFCVGIKRLADRGKGIVYAIVYTGYSLLASLVMVFAPFLAGKPDGSLEFNLFWASVLTIALFFVVECGFMEGAKGPNAYGPEPTLP